MSLVAEYGRRRILINKPSIVSGEPWSPSFLTTKKNKESQGYEREPTSDRQVWEEITEERRGKWGT